MAENSGSGELRVRCRICFEDGFLRSRKSSWLAEPQEEEDTCIAPCICSGSIKYVHNSCLQQWLRQRRRYACEICREPYIVELKRPGVLGTLRRMLLGNGWRPLAILAHVAYSTYLGQRIAQLARHTLRSVRHKGHPAMRASRAHALLFFLATGAHYLVFLVLDIRFLLNVFSHYRSAGTVLTVRGRD
eukprot:tig00000789_g4121.t1